MKHYFLIFLLMMLAFSGCANTDVSGETPAASENDKAANTSGINKSGNKPSASSTANEMAGDTSGINESSNKPAASSTANAMAGESVFWKDLKCVGRMKLAHATQFSITYYEKGFSVVKIRDGQSFLVVPCGFSVPDGLRDDLVPIAQNPDLVYIASSSCMDFWRELDALDQVPFTSTKPNDWNLSEVCERMDDGRMEFVGKYSNVDFEYLVSEGCRLAVENTMIYHTPETLEKLQSLGIPVLVERSSFEADPLGRLEWIRLWGVITGREKQADSFFFEQKRAVDKIMDKAAKDNGGKKPVVMYFSINANGVITVPNMDSYLVSLIQMAGGNYGFSDAESLYTKLSSSAKNRNTSVFLNLQMEDFFAGASDADILIYNGTINGELTSAKDLTAKNPLFADFSAVKSGKLWCQNGNLFQHPTALVVALRELRRVFCAKDSSGMDDAVFFRGLPLS